MTFFLTTSWLIPAFMLAGFLLILALRERAPGCGARVAQVAAGLSLLWGIAVFLWTLQAPYETPYRAELYWTTFGTLPIHLGILIDRITGLMLLVVTFVSLMVMIYSEGYMHGDPRFHRFFAILCLFAASMLGLVLSDNYLTFVLCWEGMGLCSYLLIGFWFEKPSAMRAAKKAFLTTRVGDIGLLFGIWLLFAYAGSFQFEDIFHNIGGALPATVAAAAALLLFCGTIGKSAQFPLHVWLPDAMEGPTPVSCFIHAATMVAAGIYLVARSYPLFTAGAAGPDGLPELAQLDWPLVGAVTAPGVVAVIGAVTVLIGALTAIAQDDIKRILAYSTISQLGYMAMALGVGALGIASAHGHEEVVREAAFVTQAGLVAALFHLATHACFKGLLFLGSGSVIHGSGTQDIWEMGGLRRAMPTTFLTFTVGTAALMGFPLTAGFWSKDEILAVALQNAPLFFWIGALGAALTAFYMTRCWIIAFLGDRRPLRSVPAPTAQDAAAGDGHEHDGESAALHAHESPRTMTVPLVILAVPSALAGLVGTPFANWIHHWLAPNDPVHAVSFVPMLIGTSAFAVGTLAGWVVYGPQPAVDPIRTVFPAVFRFLANRMYFDSLLVVLLVKPMFVFVRFFALIDRYVIDGAVNGVGFVTMAASRAWRWVDTFVVDGAVNAVGWVTGFVAEITRQLQTGRVQTYLAILVVGLLTLFALASR